MQATENIYALHRSHTTVSHYNAIYGRADVARCAARWRDTAIRTSSIRTSIHWWFIWHRTSIECSIERALTVIPSGVVAAVQTDTAASSPQNYSTYTSHSLRSFTSSNPTSSQQFKLIPSTNLSLSLFLSVCFVFSIESSCSVIQQSMLHITETPAFCNSHNRDYQHRLILSSLTPLNIICQLYNWDTVPSWTMWWTNRRTMLHAAFHEGSA